MLNVARNARLPILLWICIGVLAFVPLVVAPMLPAIDLYNHVARFFILSRIDSDPFLARYYAPNWRLLPNLGLDIPAVWLAGFVPPLLLAKLIVGGIIAAQVAATLLLNRLLTGRINAVSVLLAVALGYSFILDWGFINYLLAQSLLLGTLAAWVALRGRQLIATLVCGTLAVLILFCHGFAFALYGLVVGALEAGLWWQARRGESVFALVSRWPALARGWLLIAVQAVVPLVLFARMATSQATTSQTAARPADRALDVTIIDKIRVQAAHRLEGILRVAETPWPWIDVLLFVATALLLVLALRRRWIRIVPAAWLMLGAAMVLVVAMPNGMFGAGHLFERMPLLFALLLAASIDRGSPRTRGSSLLLVALASITLVRLVAVDVGWSAYRRQYADFLQVTASLPPHAMVVPLLVSGPDDRDGFFPRCQGLGPLTVTQRQAVSPLFADPAQQPLLMRVELDQAQDAIEAEDRTAVALGLRPLRHDQQLARLAAQRRAGFVLVCGLPRLRAPLPNNVSKVASAGEISLLRIN